MSSSVGVVDFFIVEANEYIDRLDALLAAAGPSGPDPEAFTRAARALRGSATMARQQGMADLAAALERVGRALRGAGSGLRWEPSLSAVLVAAVDDLRILLRNVRHWGAEEESRAQARTAELSRLAPPPPASTPAGRAAAASPGAGGAGSPFLASETSELARALDHFLATSAAEARAKVIERVRALRGVADVRDLAPLPEVMETVEDVLKTIELSAPAAATARQQALLAAAAALLRRASRDIAARGRPATDLPELAPFNAARAALAEERGSADRIVPITELFYDDAGPHVIAAAPHPPTTAAERFRLEVVSLAEHLRLVVAEARSPTSTDHRERLAREMQSALRALGSAANSFGETLVARFAAAWSERTDTLDASALAALDEAAALLANPATRTEELGQALERLAAPHAPQAPAAPAAPAPPTGQPPRREPIRTPTGRELHDFLQNGIAGFRDLEERPLSPPVPLPDEEIVPIEQLLYRGRRALERAAQLRAEILRQDGTPSREAVQELFDLIDLALVD